MCQYEINCRFHHLGTALKSMRRIVMGRCRNATLRDKSGQPRSCQADDRDAFAQSKVVLQQRFCQIAPGGHMRRLHAKQVRR
jgi:hypothetical protein